MTSKWTFIYMHIVIELWKLWSYVTAEAATGGVPQKKVSLQISQNSQKNTCARDSFLMKLQALVL